MGELRVMDGTGDTKLIWDSNNESEVEVAEETFKKLKKKGYVAFSVTKKGDKDKVIDEFDPDAEKIILAPKIQGG